MPLGRDLTALDQPDLIHTHIDTSIHLAPKPVNDEESDLRAGAHPRDVLRTRDCFHRFYSPVPRLLGVAEAARDSALSMLRERGADTLPLRRVTGVSPTLSLGYDYDHVSSMGACLTLLRTRIRWYGRLRAPLVDEVSRH